MPLVSPAWRHLHVPVAAFRAGSGRFLASNGKAKAVLQDVASYEATQETLALLKVLALGQQEVAAGKAKLLSAVVARLKAKKALA